jgi:hypothetical protein
MPGGTSVLATSMSALKTTFLPTSATSSRSAMPSLSAKIRMISFSVNSYTHLIVQQEQAVHDVWIALLYHIFKVLCQMTSFMPDRSETKGVSYYIVDGFYDTLFFI